MNCTVNGMPVPGAICKHVMTGLKKCGSYEKCKYHEPEQPEPKYDYSHHECAKCGKEGVCDSKCPDFNPQEINAVEIAREICEHTGIPFEEQEELEFTADDIISVKTALTKIGVSTPVSNDLAPSQILSLYRKLALKVRYGIYETPNTSHDAGKE